MASLLLKALTAIIAIVALFAVYGIYTGRRSSDEALQYAIDAAKAAGDHPINASVIQYRSQGHNTYTCGTVHIQGKDGKDEYRLFLVIQTGPTLTYLGTHYEGEKTFASSYTEHCM